MMKINYTITTKLVVIVLWCIVCNAYGQVTNPSTYDLQFADAMANCGANPTSFCTSLQIKATTDAPPFAIGTHTLVFSYNKNAITTPTYTASNFDDNIICPTDDSSDSQPYNTPSFSFDESGASGLINISTSFNGFVSGSECPVIAQDWISIGQVCFTVVNSTETTDLRIDADNTIILDSEDDRTHDQGTFALFNQPIGVTAGTPNVTPNFVCRGDDVIFSVADYILDLDDPNAAIVSLMVSNDGTIDNFNDLFAAQIYQPQVGDYNVFTNADVTYPVNTPFYIYSILGDKTTMQPINCSGLAGIGGATGPFVMLDDINLTLDTVFCDGSGVGQMQFSVTGGLPAYDDTEFTIDVSGTTTPYAGASRIRNEETFTVEVREGDSWTIIVTDETGCQTVQTEVYTESNYNCACSADAGRLDISKSYICPDDSINFSISDYVLGDLTNGYVGLIVTDNPNFNDFDTDTILRLFEGETATYFNIGVEPSRLNTPLYAYAFIGESENPGFAVDPNCTDITAAQAPFYMLTNIFLNEGDNGFNYSCTSNTAATLALSVGGGVPNVDDSEVYTLLVDGLEYTGPTEVRKDEIITLPVNHGDVWTLTIRDVQGCELVVSDVFDANFYCDGINTNATCSLSAGAVVPDAPTDICIGSGSLVRFSSTVTIATPVKHTIFVGGTSENDGFGNVFSPDRTTVNLGDTVEFIWVGSGFHNVNFSTNDAWDFADVVSATNSHSIIVDSVGTFPFQCDPHESLGMTGELTVEAAAPAYDYIIVNNNTGLVTSFGAEALLDENLGVGDYCVLGVAHDGNYTINVNDAAPVTLSGDCFAITPCTTEATVRITTCANNCAISAGEDAIICDNTVRLEATALAIGDGVWSVIAGNGSFADDRDPTSFVNDLAPGDNVLQWSYTNDDCGTITETVIITVQGITYNTIVTPIEVCGGTGSIEVRDIVGGNGNYTTTLTNSDNIEVGFENLISGVYLLTIQDDVSCMVTSDIVLSEPTGCTASICNAFDIVATETTAATCDNNNGIASITIATEDGMGPFNYIWTNTATGQIVQENLSETAISSTVVALFAGSYTVVVTDVSGSCDPLTTNVTISNTEVPLLNIIKIQPPTTCGASDGFILFAASGNGLGFTLTEVDNPDNVQTATYPENTVGNLIAGSYLLQATDENGCQSVKLFDVPRGPLTFELTPTLNNATCGQNNGSINLAVTNGDNLVYTWLDAADNILDTPDPLNVDGLVSGTYQLLVGDGNGCDTTVFLAIDDLPTPTLEILTVNSIRCTNDDDGSIDFRINDGTAPYTYTLVNGDLNAIPIADPTNVTINNLVAGNYLVRLDDANGCVAISDILTITEPRPLSVSVGVIDITSCGSEDGTICFTINDGMPPYQISDGTTTLATFEASVGEQCLRGLSPRSYDLTIIDANGCSVTLDRIEINEPADCSGCCAGFAITTSTRDADCGGTNGEANVTITSGSGEYILQWIDVNSGNIIVQNDAFEATFDEQRDLRAGVYEVVIQDKTCSCPILQERITINETTAPVVTITRENNDITCPDEANATIEFEVSGGVAPLSYTIIGASVSATIDDPNTTITTERISAGDYIIEVIDASGCKGYSDIVSFEAPNSFEIDYTTINVAQCNDLTAGAICLTITGGTPPYRISSEVGTIDNTLDRMQVCFTDLTIGDYNLSILDDRGCERVLPTISIAQTVTCETLTNCDAVNAGTVNTNEGLTEVIACVGDANGDLTFFANTATIEAGLTYTYFLTDENSNILQVLTGDSFDFENSPVGNCLVYGALYNGDLTANIGDNIVNISSSECLDLSDNAITISRSSVDAGLISTDIGETNLTICDDNTQNTVFTFVNTTDGSNNYTYIVTDANDFIVIREDSGIIDLAGMDAGAYAIHGVTYVGELAATVGDRVTDAAATGCLAITTSPVTLTREANCNTDPCFGIILSIADNITPASCGANSGQICLTVSGGTAPYQLEDGTILSEGVEHCITDLVPSTYNFTVSDSNGCSQSTTLTVTEAGNDMSVTSSAIPAACGQSGSACFTILGGTGVYLVTNGTDVGNFIENFEQCISGLTVGTQVFTITDENGCSITETVIIEETNNAITATATTTNASCGEANGQFCLTITGGTGPYTVSDNTGGNYGSFDDNTARCISDLSSGTYTLTILDNTGCSTSQTIVIEENANSITVSQQQATDATCGENNGAICLTISGGVAPYQIVSGVNINATTGENEQSCFTDLAADTYTISITDNIGCIHTETITVSGATVSVINAQITTVDVTSCTENNGFICFNSITGGVSPYIISDATTVYDTIVENSTECLNNLAPGNYQLLITDAEGCTKTVTALIAQPTDCNTDSSQASGDCEPVTYDCTGISETVVICPNFCTITDYSIQDISTQLTGQTAILSGDTCFSYQPFPGISDMDTISITACDANNVCETSTVYLTIGTCNLAPMAIDDEALVVMNQAKCIDVLANDYDVDGDNITISDFTQGTNGVVTLNEATNDLCYTATPIPDGQSVLDINDTFTYTACDGDGCSEATVNITILVAEENPDDCVNPNNLCTAPGIPIPICVTFCDLPTPGSIRDLKTTFECGLQILNDSCLRYTPLPGQLGEDTVQITGCVADSSICQTIFVAVTSSENCDGTSNPPVATNDIKNTNIDVPVLIDVLANDSEPDGDEIKINTFTQPANGTVSFGSDGQTLVYTPNPGFTGTDNFTYEISDGDGEATATVTVSVNGPCENPDNLCAEPQQALTFCVQFCDLPGAVVQDAHATFDCGLQVLDNNCVQFTPLPGYSGNETLQVIGCTDAGVCDTIFVNVTVQADCNEVTPCENPTNLCTAPQVPIEFCVNFCNVPDATVQELHATFDCGLTSLGNNCVEYVPLPGQFGPNVVEVIGCNTSGQCDTVYVDVLGANNCDEVDPTPIANNDQAITPINTPITVDILGNDSSPIDSPLHIDSFTQPTNGTVTFNEDSTQLVYTPNQDYDGGDAFEYTVCDEEGNCSTATVNVTIVNDTCENPDNLCTAPFTSLIFCVKFCDLPGAVVQDVHPTLFECGISVLNDSCVQYTPLPGFFGAEILEVVGCTDAGVCDTIIVNLFVGDCTISENQPPVAVNDSITLNKIEPVEICPLVNDSDPDGTHSLKITAFDAPSRGEAVLNNDSTCFIYTPDPDFEGEVTFNYQVCDDSLACDEATIVINIAPACGNNIEYFCTVPLESTVLCVEFCNLAETDTITIQDVHTTFSCGIDVLDASCFQYTPLPGFEAHDSLFVIGCNQDNICDTVVIHTFVGCAAPVARDDYVTVPNNQTAIIDPTENDMGICADPMFLDILQQGNNGSANLDNNNNVIYEPNSGFVGFDTLTYLLCNPCDLTDACDSAKIIITVEEPTEQSVDAQPDIATTPFETPVVIPVLDNDLGDNLVITDSTTPENGTINENPDGTISYFPSSGFSGTDYFTYTVCIAETNICDQTLVSVEVLPENNPNRPPDANNDVAITPTDNPVEIPVLANDSDPEGDDLIIDSFTDPENGTVTFNEDSTALIYTPDPGFEGIDTFTYVVCDNGVPVACTTATVGVEVGDDVIQFSNQPPVGVADMDTTAPATPVAINVLANDSDPNPEDNLTITLGSTPAHGTAQLLDDSTFLYTPEDGFLGTDNFMYIICDDGIPVLCDTAYVSIAVLDLNSLPAANDDEVSTFVDTPIQIDILGNDLFVEENDLTIEIITSPNFGVAFDTDENPIAYSPDAGYIGVDSFVYVICDTTAVPISCDTATVVVNIEPPMIANPDIAFTPIDIPVVIDVLDNDEGLNPTVTDILTPPENGTVNTNPDGTLTYDPVPEFTGTDYFEYIACDELNNCDTTIVAIIIHPDTIANFPPIGVNDIFEIPEDEPVILPVLDNDVDLDNDPLIITAIIDEPIEGGTVTFNEDSTALIFTPDPNFEGCINFGYVVCDTENACDTAYVGLGIDTNECLNLPPTAVDDEYTTTVGQPITVTPVTDNDTDPTEDPDDNILTVALFTDPAHGELVLENDSTTFTYTPEPEFIGEDYFVYVICDDGTPTLCDTAYVTITVQPNQVDAEPDIAFTSVNTPTDIDVLANDEGTDLTISDISTPPQNGTVGEPNEDGTITYTPDPDFVGTDYFEYIVCDVANNCDTTLVTIEVLPEDITNIPPNAVNDMAFTPVDTPVDIDVLANDNDPFDDDEIFLDPDGVTDPENGTAEINEEGLITYTPDPGFEGIDTFSYTICDNDIPTLCDDALVVVNVGGDEVTNNPPIAVDDEETTPINEPVDIDLLANDSDPDEDNIVVTFLSEPANGTVNDPVDGIVNYTPDNNYVGEDFFSYIICDDGLPSLCDTAYVTVTIEPRGLDAEPDIVFTPVNTPIDVDVLANDEGLDLTVIEVVEEPDNGTTSAPNEDGTITYTPDPDFVGTDYFEYLVCDANNVCDTTLVTVVVLPEDVTNLPPNAVNDAENTPVNTPVTFDVLANDNDPFGGDEINLLSFTNPENGTLEPNEEGVFTYTPNQDFTGIDTFSYIICDNGIPSLCDEAVVAINVGSNFPSNTPPLAVDDEDTTEMATPILIDILANDSDPEGDELTITFLSEPDHGEVADPIDGVVAYMPEDDYTGQDFFSYIICDNGLPSLCDTAYVTITILPQTVNAEPDIVFTPINTPVDIPVTDNDEGTDLTVTEIVEQPDNGVATITDPENGIVTYTPNEDFVGTDYLEYVVCDANNNCDTTLVTIEVLPEEITNLPPNAVNDMENTPINTPVDIEVLENDNDPFGGDEITITENTNPQNGTVEQTADDTFTYTPNEDFTGIDSFSYTICDNGEPSLCDEALVVINVGSTDPPNNPPVAIDDEDTTEMATPIMINILANDSDPDGDDITVTFLSEPDHGEVSPAIDGVVEYTPEDNYTGQDFFSYIICDNGIPSLCDTAYVTITILPQGIDAQPDIVFTAINTPIDIDVTSNDEGTNLTVTEIVDEPENGTATIIDPENGIVTYTPEEDFVGVDYFEYQVCDENNNCDITLVTITILPEDITNLPPNAVNDVETTPVNTPVAIDVLENDNDPFGGDEITITENGEPANGTVEQTADDTFTYTPNEDFTGIDSFSYTICDNGNPSLCDEALVVITVGDNAPSNDPPVAVDDNYITLVNTPLTVDILENDTDPNEDNITITFLSEPIGTVENNEDGTVTYTPPVDSVLNDFFSYIICDDGLPILCDTAYVTISITDTLTGIPDIFIEMPANTDTVLCIEQQTTVNCDVSEIQTALFPANGSLDNIADGDSCLIYTPNPDYCGADEITLVLFDGEGTLCDTVSIFINVICPPLPPVAVTDSVVTQINTPVDIPVLGNDFDPNEDNITLVELLDEDVLGTTVLGIDPITGDPVVTYTPPTDFVGTDSFQYVIVDESGLLDTGTVYVIVEPIIGENILEAVDDFSTTTINTSVEIPILSNDDIPEGSTNPAITIITDPINEGSVTVEIGEEGDSTVTYTPPIGFIGVDTFVYSICVEFETNILCDTAIVIVTIEADVNPEDCVPIFAQGFSPNGDEINDVFIIDNADILTACFPQAQPELIIFNRWGDVVYHQMDYNNDKAWDGTWQKTGQDVPVGTYYYIFNLNIPEVSPTSGFLEVVR